ncbi:MAG TPA: YggS family pyridoxal phosphate-dependent enzyme [Vicinamibacteria bacterium]|nr:YggS family pyridoxal phosphate-dependent enzyme [Vicinamibacteria bacterium]
MIADRVAAVRERIHRAAARAGRSPDDVVLVAVTKTHPPEVVREAFAAGLRDFGENRVQEAEEKVQALAELRTAGIRWHLVGHLQSNKARKAVPLFDLVHSLDDAELGRRLDRIGSDEARVVRTLVQVDLAGEGTKSGLPEAALLPTLEALRGLPSLRIEGLMVLPPFSEDPERTRPYFRRLRELRDRARAQSLLSGTDLSMGMSHDFEVAIEEGATLVRVGTELFGERKPA